MTSTGEDLVQIRRCLTLSDSQELTSQNYRVVFDPVNFELDDAENTSACELPSCYLRIAFTALPIVRLSLLPHHGLYATIVLTPRLDNLKSFQNWFDSNNKRRQGELSLLFACGIWRRLLTTV